MRAFRSFLLAGLFAGALAAGTSTAHAARIGVVVGFGAPAVQIGYVPACPGPDYYWNAGYYVGRVWYPGRWLYRARVDRDYGFRDHAYQGAAYRDRAYVAHRDFDHGRDFRHDDRGHEGYRR